MSFQDIKLFLMQVTFLSKDALHIYIGLAIYLVVAIFFVKSLRSYWPWLIVLAATILGEMMDIRHTQSLNYPIKWHENIHDVFNTLFWPTILLVLARQGALERFSSQKRRPPP